MRENEADYAVSFAIPVATKGVHLICRPGRGERSAAEFPSNRPNRDLVEAMIVFDNVLVPWDRVFLCREWQYSMLLAYTFATYHRFTAVSYKIPIVEIMAGIALAMAEVNGLEKVGHIRGKLSEVDRLRRDAEGAGHRRHQVARLLRRDLRAQPAHHQHGEATLREELPRDREDHPGHRRRHHHHHADVSRLAEPRHPRLSRPLPRRLRQVHHRRTNAHHCR